MRRNPFDKFIGPETWLQQEIITYCRYRYPQVEVVHVPNEGRRSNFERYLFKLLGTNAGVADLLFMAPGRRVLWLEVKAGQNKPTDEQAQFLQRMSDLGFSALWTNSFDAAKIIIDAFAKNEAVTIKSEGCIK